VAIGVCGVRVLVDAEDWIGMRVYALDAEDEDDRDDTFVFVPDKGALGLLRITEDPAEIDRDIGRKGERTGLSGGGGLLVPSVLVA
jgi:hypothetical protein